jgi:hypothetical protein
LNHHWNECGNKSSLSTICDRREGVLKLGCLDDGFGWSLGFFVIARKTQSSKSVEKHIDYIWAGQILDLYLLLTNVLHMVSFFFKRVFVLLVKDEHQLKAIPLLVFSKSWPFSR